MPTIVKGFAVGHSTPTMFADGTTGTRPKLVEYEALGATIAVSIGCESLHLDHEAACAFRDALSNMIEGMS